QKHRPENFEISNQYLFDHGGVKAKRVHYVGPPTGIKTCFRTPDALIGHRAKMWAEALHYDLGVHRAQDNFFKRTPLPVPLVQWTEPDRVQYNKLLRVALQNNLLAQARGRCPYKEHWLEDEKYLDEDDQTVAWTPRPKLGDEGDTDDPVLVPILEPDEDRPLFGRQSHLP
ncbi:MAG: hypothetical protein AAFO96_29650, partial [Bacteroidota bacterium]